MSSGEGNNTTSSQLLNTAKLQDEIAAKKENFQDDIFEQLPKEVSDIIEKLPREEGEKVSKSFQIMSSFQGIMPSSSPLLKKLTEEHITRIIDNSQKSEERELKYALWSKFYLAIFIIFGIGVFVFLTVYLAKNSSALYMDIMKVVFGFLGGFGVGTAFKKKT